MSHLNQWLFPALVLVAACGSDVTDPDGGKADLRPPLDFVMTQVMPDLSVLPDFTPPPDLAAARDFAKLPDTGGRTPRELERYLGLRCMDVPQKQGGSVTHLFP